MRTYIAVEIPKGITKPSERKIHEISVPDLNEPDGRFQILSIQAFMQGKRKGAGKSDRKHMLDLCCWGPKALYSLKPKAVWEEDVEMTMASLKQALPEYPDDRTFPRTQHASIWDFYKHIGFDHKLRGYRDKAGKEIKFSNTEPKEKGPEMC
jgi:hypothetical protein